MFTGPPSLSAIPSLVDAETGAVILRGRFKNPKEVLAAYQTYFTADQQSSRDRALHQAQIDGAPPYNDAKDRMKGLFGRFNANFGFASRAQEEAEQPYNDVLESIDVFGKTPTRFGSEVDRLYYGQVIAEEITSMVKNWDDFYTNWQLNAHLFTQEGLSFAFFQDDYTWKWDIRGRQHFKFPRRAKANVNNLDVIACRAEMMPHELYANIENAEEAEKAGWNVVACMDAIKSAKEQGLETDNPETWQQDIKDQNIYSSVTSQTITVVHCLSREVDGTVSHYIVRYDGVGDFLYKSLGKWHSMHRCLVAFTNAVGSNGDFDSIRGNGYRIFQSASALNRMYCKMMDASTHGATPYLSYGSEDSITANAFHPMGPYMAVQNDLQFQQVPSLNIAQNLMPAVQMVEQVFGQAARFSAPTSAGSVNRTEKTKYQVQTENEQTGRMTTASFNLFFAAWGRLWKEVVRRVCREEYLPTEPGGEEVWQLRARLLERGVPLEALYSVDINAVTVNTGIGKGSVSERRAQVDALMERIMPYLDPNGQQTLLRLVAAAYGDTRLARELVPDSGPRKPIDAQVAKMENSLMSLGMPPAFEPDQNHAVHVQEHLAWVSQINDSLANGEMPLEEAIPAMQPAWQHAQDEHLPLLNPNSPETAQYRQALQQFGEVIINGGKHLAREAEKQAQQGGEMGGESPMGVERQAADAAARTAFLEGVSAQAKAASLELGLASKQQEMQQRAEDHRQKMALRDAETAAKLLRQNAEAKAKMSRTPNDNTK
jgi:hypothetical protein